MVPKNGSFHYEHIVKIIENRHSLCEVGQLLHTQCWIYKLYLRLLPTMMTESQQCVIMLINRTATACISAGCIIFRFSTTVDVWREDRTPLRMQRIVINNLQKDYIIYKVFFGCTLLFLCPIQYYKFKCIWPMPDASTLRMPYL